MSAPAMERKSASCTDQLQAQGMLGRGMLHDLLGVDFEHVLLQVLESNAFFALDEHEDADAIGGDSRH